MSDVDGGGPPVANHEILLRAITSSDWWVEDERRVSSAAFKNRCFSVNVESICGLEGALEHLNTILDCPHGGLASFECGEARRLSFDARHEQDPNHPDNIAHASVYGDRSSSRRSRNAKKLARLCSIVHVPNFNG